MCKAEGMGICPWGSLGGGKFKTEAERQSGEGRAMLMGGRTEADIKVINALEIIAKRKNTALVSIALAYVMHKTTYVFPIVGGRKLEQLRSNIEALAIELSTEDIQAIEAATPFDLGFPHSFLWAGGSADNPQDVGWLNMAAIFDYVEDAIVCSFFLLLHLMGRGLLTRQCYSPSSQKRLAIRDTCWRGMTGGGFMGSATIRISITRRQDCTAGKERIEHSLVARK